jgi:hypothetical protein
LKRRERVADLRIGDVAADDRVTYPFEEHEPNVASADLLILMDSGYDEVRFDVTFEPRGEAEALQHILHSVRDIPAEQADGMR